MTLQELIFRDDRYGKFRRHFIFWSVWFIYLSCTQLRNQTPDEIGIRNFIVYQLGVSANRVLLQMAFCYPFIYWVIPRFFLKRKFIGFAMLTAGMLFGIYWLTYWDYILIWSDINSPIFFNIPHVKPLSVFQCHYFAIYSNLHCTGTLVAASLILSVQYYKNWYRKERENEMLKYQQAEAELQLLKAQVHPHFLFNTLNNIYALMLDDSPRAITVLNELSGMVRYMIHEGAEAYVPLDKEIRMLTDYIGLEKIRYGERLEMELEILHHHTGELFIAPLLMIPFVENSFKHGASRTMEKSTIRLQISTDQNWLEFILENNIFPFPETEEDRVKIGLKNVRKRLQILYPAKHELHFGATDDTFSVVMKIHLDRKMPVGEKNIIHNLQKNLSYAR